MRRLINMRARTRASTASKYSANRLRSLDEFPTRRYRLASFASRCNALTSTRHVAVHRSCVKECLSENAETDRLIAKARFTTRETLSRILSRTASSIQPFLLPRFESLRAYSRCIKGRFFLSRLSPLRCSRTNLSALHPAGRAVYARAGVKS